MSRVTQKGQVTIPQEFRMALGIEVGDDVTFRRTARGTIELVKLARPSPFGKYKGALKHLRGKKTDEIVRELRGDLE